MLDPEVIYARALALEHINRGLDFEKLLVYVLARYPTQCLTRKEQCVLAIRNQNQ